MNYTQNYQLNQWAESDRVMRVDFNADNIKIDAALAEMNASKADRTALTSLDAVVSSKADQSAVTGLGQQITALTASIGANSTALADKGNCEIFKASYIGTGTFGAEAPQVWTFASGTPLFVVIVNDYHNVAIRMINGVTQSQGTNISRWTFISWSGNTVSWYGEDAGAQFNDTGIQYHMVALLSRS